MSGNVVKVGTAGLAVLNTMVTDASGNAVTETKRTGFNKNAIESLSVSGNDMRLDGDSAAPGNDKLYGTNGSGVKGWYDIPTSAVWGSITGTLSNQTDLQTELDGKADSSHTHVEADITDLQSYLLNITGEPLSDLSDVTLTAIGAGEILKWSGAAWVNNTLAEAGIAAASHTHVEADITDLGNYAVIGGAHHDGFSDFVANEHIDHTSVTLTAGAGLSGGGDISASRSFTVNVQNSIEIATDTLQLVGDAASPGNSKVYGTNGSGVKGWYDQGGGATNIGDLGDVTITTPSDDEVLVYDSGTWVNTALPTGAASTTISGWTLESGDLYSQTFAHNLATTDVAVFAYDTVTSKEIRFEDVEIIDTNTVKVYVRGNTHNNIKLNVVTGRGPAGPTGPSASWGTITGTLSNQTDLQSALDGKAASSHTHVKADITDFDHTHTFRYGHTWAISGEVKVASGDTDFILPFFISMASGQTAQVVKARYKINSGTNCNVKIQKNDVDLTGFTNITVTQTAATTAPAAQSLAEDDKLALVVNSVSGTPKNLSFTLFIEYTQ